MSQTNEPVILHRSSHAISRKDIDPDALKVLYRLSRSGHKAYLVGGAVRDLLLGKKPKDFDVATDARPGQIKKLFANCFLIGRRFRLAHIRFRGGKVIEVATFRREPDPTEEADADLHNTFGSPAEDAFRRDITINSLFYDITTFSVIDYTGGLRDIAQRRVCIIGDPEVRYTEDPVRMVRVLRHAARHGFSIEHRTARAIQEKRELLKTCSGSRMYEEFNKDLHSGCAAPIFSLLMQYSLLSTMLGEVGGVIEQNRESREELLRLLGVLDKAVRSGQPPVPTIAYALLLRPWVRMVMDRDAGRIPDRIKYLTDVLAASGMGVVIPKAIRMNALHSLEILEHMFSALQSGRMRWSLEKKASYQDAAMLFTLITQGRVSDGMEAFREAFRERFPEARTSDRRRKRRRRRGRKRSPEATSPVSGGGDAHGTAGAELQCAFFHQW
ncbi:MAG TPA: polynucleotide adenylyltransferase PcnB [Deltaproteobacteria bacterium]|nr:polynucleotide adenylyltransferase PcnB [Deltaproteobacteria bacterium]HQI81512.1 polynucleotide adenylyltransferase PcnB [Deltaproteobacteria bacterium]